MINDKKVFAELLCLCAPWEVVSVTTEPAFSGRSRGRCTIELAVKRGQLVPCPECGRMCKRHDQKWREWRDVECLGWEALVRAKVPRANCPEHGVRSIDVPWAEPYSHHTVMLEWRVLEDLRQMSIQAVAVKHGLNWKLVGRIHDRAVARGQARQQEDPPTRIGIDETSFQKRMKYVTLVVDLTPEEGRYGRVLYVADGKGYEAIAGYFEQLGPAACQQIKVIAMDMAAPYLKAARKYTNARVCIDRFHVVSLASRAMEQVRRAEAKKLESDGDHRLKGTRYDWLLGPERRSPMRERRLAEMRKQHLKTVQAYELKEWIRELWALKNRRLAYLAWELWREAVERSQLAPMRRAANTLWKHVEEILNAMMLRVSNATTESVNARVQWLKRQACGYRNTKRFHNAILFHLGGLDLRPNLGFHSNV